MHATTSLTDDQLRLLQQRALDESFTGRAAIVYPKSFEEDGRKRSRVLREAIELGFIEVGDDETYKVSSRVLATIEGQEADLFEIWKTNSDQHESKTAFSKPWICVSGLSLGVQKAISLATGVDWYVVSMTPYKYHATFSDEPEHVIDDAYGPNKFSGYWAGPFEHLESAKERLRCTDGTCLAVSSRTMREDVSSFQNERMLEWQFGNNVLWGLAKLGIIPEDEIFTSDDKPRIDPQFNEGEPLRLGRRRSPESPAEVTWESNLAKSIERIKDQIQRHEKQLALLWNIRDGIEKYGGWQEFKTDYKATLRDELLVDDHQPN